MAYIVQNYPKYRRIFRFAQNTDELLVQTIVLNSPYREHLFIQEFKNDYRAVMRYIDWERGTPYVFREEDFDELKNSDFLFARKFDERTDRRIIELIYESVVREKREAEGAYE